MYNLATRSKIIWIEDVIIATIKIGFADDLCI